MAQITNGESGLSVRTKINASIGKTDLITVTEPVDLDNLPAGEQGPQGEQGPKGDPGNDGASVTIHEFTDEGAAEAFALTATPLQITVLK